MEHEPFEVSEARIKFGNSSWEGFTMDNYEIETKIGNQIERSFTYQAPKADQPDRYIKIRDEAKALAYTIVKNTPPSREQSLALTNLEQTVMWANAAIARNE